MVGSGLGGASAAATLSELGYNVKCFCFQDSPRRAHSIAAQGGINAAKNYRNDGDSIYRLFYDTVKGGDFRSREANVYRLAQISVNIIDQCVAQGVPFAREYGGLLANRSFGGAQVSRTFYARGQTGQQLLLGAYQALEREIAPGRGDDVSPHRDARPGRDRRPGPRHRRPATWSRGKVASHVGDAVVLGTGGYGNVFYLSTNAKGSQRDRDLARVQAGRGVRQSVLHPDPPDLHSGERRVPVEAHADERVAAQRRPGLGSARSRATSGRRARSPKPSATTTWSGSIPSFGNLAPRDIASRAAKEVCDEGRGVGESGLGVYLDFADAIKRLGERDHPRALRQPVRDVPADHRRESVRGADAHLSGRPLHDGRAVGGLQPDEHHSRDCTSSARPTSPITAPTGSGRAR